MEKDFQDQSLPLPSEDLILDSGSNLVRIPLAKKGTWFHPKYGRLEFTDNDLQSLENNFKENSLGFTPYITFGHLDEEHQSTDSHRKRGDLVNFTRDQDTLFGVFQAKPEAFEEIKAGNYEFASGEFIRGFTDKNTGEERGLVFERAALTNSPYLPFDKEEKATVILSNGYSCFKLSMTEASVIDESVVEESVTGFINPVTEEPKVSMQFEPAAIEEIQKDSEPEIEIKEMNMTTANQEVEVKETSSVTTIPEASKEVEAIKEEITQAAVETASSNKSFIEASEVQALVEAALEGVKKQYEGQLQALSQEVAAQQKLSNQFSQKLAHEEKVALSQSLSAAGVPPAFIDRLHMIKDALSTNSKTVKLSQGETIVDIDLFKVITQLLTDALGVQAVDETQHGANKSESSNEFIDSIKAITERNRKLVAKA